MSQSIFPTLIVNKFIPSLWSLSSTTLTREYADLHYLKYPFAQGSETIPANLTVSGRTSLGDTFINAENIHLGELAGTTSQGQYAIAIGSEAGNSNQASQAIAIGQAAGFEGMGQGSISIGAYSNAFLPPGENAIAIGKNASSGSITAQGISSIAIGENSGGTNQSGAYCIAIGDNAGLTQTAADNIAIGSSSGASQGFASCIAIGKSSGANQGATNAIAIGTSAGASQLGGAIAIGTNSGPSQSANSIAIGTSSATSGADCIAIGNGANTSTFATSVAIGKNSTVGGNNQIVLGTTNENVYVPGSNFRVFNNLLIQSDATTAYIRPTNASSTLYLGTVATNYFNINSVGTTSVERQGTNIDTTFNVISGSATTAGAYTNRSVINFNVLGQGGGMTNNLILAKYINPNYGFEFYGNGTLIASLETAVGLIMNSTNNITLGTGTSPTQDTQLGGTRSGTYDTASGKTTTFQAATLTLTVAGIYLITYSFRFIATTATVLYHNLGGTGTSTISLSAPTTLGISNSYSGVQTQVVSATASAYTITLTFTGTGGQIVDGIFKATRIG